MQSQLQRSEKEFKVKLLSVEFGNFQTAANINTLSLSEMVIGKKVRIKFCSDHIFNEIQRRTE